MFMSRRSAGLTWIIALTIGALGWTFCVWLLWQQKQSQESQAALQRQVEDQDARHGLAERRLDARHAELSRRIAELESEIEERRRQASEHLLTMEAEKKAMEVETATLALQYEVMKSRHAASEVAVLGERQPRF